MYLNTESNTIKEKGVTYLIMDGLVGYHNFGGFKIK